MSILRSAIAGFIVATIFGCSMEDVASDFVLLTYEYDFAQSDHGWTGMFSNYAMSDSVEDELRFEYTDLPSNLGTEKAMMFFGNNLDGDLFMFMKKQITGLRADTEYTIAFDIEFASNVYSSLGSQATNVYLKAGASTSEPEKILNGDIYLPNFDKGSLSGSGSDMMVIGDISKEEDNNPGYGIVNRNNTKAAFNAKSNAAGELWLIVGVDSGFEGITTIYFTNINAVFSISGK